MRGLLGLVIVILFLCFTTPVSAETIVLKSGKTVEGKILEKTDKSVKVDIEGVPITYYLEEIVSIDDTKVNLTSSVANTDIGDKSLPQSPKEEASIAQNQFYDFRLGSHTIDENKIKFEFPSASMQTLYLFNLSDWKGTRSTNSKLVVTLYDKDKKVIVSSSSVCVDMKYSSFGSIAFSGVSKDNINSVVYFTMSVQECKKI